MRSDVRNRIIRNLIVGGSLLSLLAGVVVTLLELARIDKLVVNLAVEHSQEYLDVYHRYHHQRDARLFQLLDQATQSAVTHDIFILIEIYDENKKKILEKIDKGAIAVISELEEEHHIFPERGEMEYGKKYLGGQMYLKILMPLLDVDDGTIIGYLDGVYHVSDKTLATIKNRVLLSLAQTIIVVAITTFLLYPVIILLNRDLARRTKELLEANINTLRSLGSAVAMRDSDTHEHNYRVTIFAISLAEKAGLKESEIRNLIKGAFLHDIGKIAISDSILLKTGGLSDEEFEIMKTHVEHGVEIICGNQWLAGAEDVILHHHEKYDGAGYPAGLKGEAIPLNARVFCIADVFDALLSRRPYKKAFSPDKAIGLIRQMAGSHFDPRLVDIFVPMADDLHSRIKKLKTEKDLVQCLQVLIHKYFTI